MSWNEMKAGIKSKYEQCKEFVKEHPVETALGIIGVGMGCFGIYKLCTLPPAEGVNLAKCGITATPTGVPITEARGDRIAELSTRSYRWHEASHPVQGHTRHLADGRVIHVSPYIKVTGGKN